MAEEHGKDKEAKTDLDSLEIEIDREIDNMFVPVVKKPDEAVPATALELEAAEPPGEKSQTGLDLDSLQVGIDMEIDSLFVPAAKREEPEEIGSLSLETEDILAPVVETKAAPAPELQFPPVEEAFRTEAPTGFMSKYTPRTELPKLIEEFNAAYLSLDWEFSADNIRRLETALFDLESFTSNVQGSASIFKILKVLLARLGAQPQTASNWMIELVRDSHSLLTHLLLTGDSPGPNEKERINALIGRFRKLRERAISAKETMDAGASAPEAPVSEELEQASLEPLPIASSVGEEAIIPAPAFESDLDAALTLPPVGGIMADWWSLVELKTWLESSRVLLMEAVEGAESELARMLPVESAMSKTEGLAPVVARLSDIRSGLERRLKVLKEQDAEWRSRVTWVENLERVSAAYADSAVEETDEPVELSEPYYPPEPDADAVHSPAPEETAPVRHDDFILFSYSGRLYGLPESHVVKIRSIPGKKAREILKRGYGSLADVKKIFQSISKGVSGKLAEMSAKDLKSIRFALIGPDVFQSEQAPSSRSLLAIFVSDGSYHGLILSESEKIDFQAEAELTRGTCSFPAALGTVQTETGLCAEIVDLGRVARFNGGEQA